MTYQPKIEGKMADFETLILCISLSSSEMCTYFCEYLRLSQFQALASPQATPGQIFRNQSNPGPPGRQI